MHWSVDLGAREFVHELYAQQRWVTLLSNVSRLYVDVNRPLQSDTLFRPMAVSNAHTPPSAHVIARENNARCSAAFRMLSLAELSIRLLIDYATAHSAAHCNAVLHYAIAML